MSVSSSASAQIPPNLDFYVLLDNSPSMALPATTAGITQLEGLTTMQSEIQGEGSGGCAFACHQASTNNSDTAGNPCANGTRLTTPTQSSGGYSNVYCNVSNQGAQIDNYQLARNNNITLRLDELKSGVSTLLQTASSTAQSSQFSTPPQLPLRDLLDGYALVDRPHQTHVFDNELREWVDHRFRQFRRNGDVFEQP